MTAPIPGQLVHNHNMAVDMHLIASYDDDSKGIYSDMRTKFAALLKRRIKDKLQNIVVITGGVGSGKSTLAIQLAKDLEGPDWDISSNYIYNAEDFKKKLSKGDAIHSVLLFDEGIVTFNSLTVNARDDREMVTLFNILRSWSMTAFICIPKFGDLNKKLRNALVDFLIMCPKKPLLPQYKARGFFEVYAPKTTPWSDKVYWELLGAGVYKALDAKTDIIYQAIKLEHQRIQVKRFLELGKKDTDEDEEADE